MQGNVKKVRTESVIEAVRNYPCLYDPKDKKYTDKLYKDRIWERISKQLNVPVQDCRVRWKSLRDRYRREMFSDKVENQVKWRYKPLLDFLSSSLRPIKEYQECDGHDIFSDSIEQAIVPENILEVNTVATDIHWLSNEAAHTTTSSKVIKRQNESQKSNLIHEVLLAMKQKYEEPLTTTNHNVQKYGNFIAMMREKLNKLSTNEVDDVQIEILQLLNKKINKQT